VSGSVRVGFVVDMTLRQGFLRVIQFSPVNIIPPWLFMHILVHHLGMNNSPVGDRSSEIQSCHIDMNAIMTFKDELLRRLSELTVLKRTA
jgi:hypothetical protein